MHGVVRAISSLRRVFPSLSRPIPYAYGVFEIVHFGNFFFILVGGEKKKVIFHFISLSVGLFAAPRANFLLAFARNAATLFSSLLHRQPASALYTLIFFRFLAGVLFYRHGSCSHARFFGVRVTPMVSGAQEGTENKVDGRSRMNTGRCSFAEVPERNF